MTAFWFFAKLAIVLALSLWISGFDGSVLVYAYGYEIHIRLWVTAVFIVLFVFFVWTVLRGLGWINSSIFYITRTRKLYQQNAVLPHIVSHMWRVNIKQYLHKPFGKKHPLSQIADYTLNKQTNIDIPHILQTPFVDYMIQQCIHHNDTEKISAIRAYYVLNDTPMPAMFYIYESLHAKSLQDSLNYLSFITDTDLKHTVYYYTAHAHIRYNSPDMCQKVLMAWKTAHTDAEKWRICILCRDINLSDVGDIVPFEKAIYKKDGMGLLLLAMLSIKLQLWGPADGYIKKSNPYLGDYTDKQNFVKSYLIYAKSGDAGAYIQALNTMQNQDII